MKIGNENHSLESSVNLSASHKKAQHRIFIQHKIKAMNSYYWQI